METDRESTRRELYTAAIKRARFWVRENRKKRYFDRLVLKMFKRVFLRWCDSHLGRAHEFGLIDNRTMHTLDAQMKGDLGFPGYGA